MSGIVLFPAGTYAILLIVFNRAFSRNTGLELRPLGYVVYSLGGALTTLAMYWAVSSAQLLDSIVFTYFSAFIEEILKFIVLLFFVSHLNIASGPQQIYKQRILSGIVLGLAFGLIETYLYLLANTQLLSGNVLLGSIPLHVVSTGFLGISLARKRKIFSTFLLVLASGVYHFTYNLLVRFPVPISYLSFVWLILGTLTILVLLTRARDYTRDNESP